MNYRYPVLFLLTLLSLISCQPVVIHSVVNGQSRSARSAAVPAPHYRGLYVDGFKRILGNVNSEDSLLNWCVSHDINALSLYDLNTVLGDERNTELARFILKARLTYGTGQVVAVRGSSANFTFI